MTYNVEKQTGKILVVDDSPALLELLMLVLTGGGHQVYSAKDGLEAVGAAQRGSPELVLLDIGLPDIDGYEVCRRLKADAATSDIPVIFLSAFGAIHDKQKGFEAGCVDYITKPFNAEEVLFRISTHLNLSRMRLQLQQQAAELGRSKEDLEKFVLELQRSQKALIRSEKMASLGRLVSEIAHEVNNPLMIISGNAQLSLMLDSISDEERSNLEVIVSECQRAKNVIRRVLRFARPNRKELRQVEISQSIEIVAGLLERQFMLASNVLIRRCYLDKAVYISEDQQQMQEVFMNLFNNAREAMPEGGTITITTALEDRFVRVDVSDTGLGMSEEVLQRITEPFFTTKESGTGIGLSVCYGIVKAHGGELRFESEPGKGTTATILLPWEPQHEPNIGS